MSLKSMIPFRSMKTLATTATLLLGLLLLGAMPAHAQSVTFNVEDASASAGTSVTVPVTVEGFSNVTTAQFTLDWDPAVLDFNSANGSAVPGLSAAAFGNPDNGTMTFSWFDPATQGETLSDGSTLFTITFDAADAGAQTTDISFADGPTPPEVTVDLSEVSFQGNDGSVTVDATPDNDAPTITNPGDQTSSEGESVSLQIQASDPDAGDQLSYSATGLPDGLSIDPSSGVISGIITDGAAANSPYSADVTVSDDASPSESASASFNWSVTDEEPTGTVTFTAGSASVPSGGQVTVPVTVEGFSDITGAQFTMEWDSSVLSFNSVGDFGAPGISGGVFGDPSETGDAGTLTFAWDDPAGTGETVGDGTTLFTITFDATGAAGNNSSVAFTNSPTPQEVSSDITELTFASTDGSVDLTAPPALDVSSTSLDFGSVDVGASASETVTLESTGGADLQISTIDLTGSGDYSQTNDCPSALSPGSDCTITVGLAPQSPGAKSGTLTIASNAGDQDVSLTGTAPEPVEPTPGISVAPSSLDFGTVQTNNTATQALTVSSTGDADLQVNDLSIGGLDASGFTVTDNGCTSPVSPGSTCEVEVEFAPGSVGDKNAQLTIASNASAQNVPLTGIGEAPPPPTSDEEVTVTVEDGSVPTGQEITVDVTVENFTSVTGTQFTLDWDSSLLQLASVSSGALDGVTGGDASSLGSVFAMPSAGTLAFAWDDPDATGKTLSDDAVIFSLTFNAVGAGDNSAGVSFTNSPTEQLVFVDFAEATFTGEAGTVDILSQVPISGAVTYYDGLPLEGSSLSLNGDQSATTTTDGDGNYSFMSTVGGNVQLDASMSNDPPVPGGVNVNDLSLTRRHILGVESLDAPVTLVAADVDGSQSVNINDVSLMRQFVLGINDSFDTGLWQCIVKGSATTDPIGYDTEYSYTPIASAQAGQDFFCYRKGDVDGSWSPTDGSTLAAAESHSGPSASVRLSMESRPVEDSDEVIVHVTADQFSDVGGYQFTMEWDAEALEFAGVEQFGLNGLSAKNFGTHRTDEGLLSTVWSNPKGEGRSLPDGETLFALRFRPVGSAVSTIDLSSEMTPALAHRGNASLTPMGLSSASGTVQPSSLPETFTLTGNYPNPVGQSTQIAFDLPESATVSIEVYDLLGRQVLQVPDREMVAGAERTVQLDASSLAPGSYFYRVRAELSSETTTQTGQMTVVK